MRRGIERRGLVERVIWVVDDARITGFLNSYIPEMLGPTVKVRSFAEPEKALRALSSAGAPPDVLMTAFYFDGLFNNGLWLIQEARKVCPKLRTILASGFGVDHLKGVAAEWKVQPDKLIPKGEKFTTALLPALKGLLANPPKAKAARRSCWQPTATPECPKSARAAKVVEQRRRSKRPVVYFVGAAKSLSALKWQMGQEAHPVRFQKGYAWEHFEDPKGAWVSLEKASEKPQAIVTDYFLSGSFINGLKLVRHAQKVVPGILTVLAHDLDELHVQGVMKGTGIAPDLLFEWQAL